MLRATVVLAGLALVASCGSRAGEPAAAAPSTLAPTRPPARPPANAPAPAPSGATSAPLRVERLRIAVLASHPHDAGSYTQGLLWHAGSLYESSGLYGQSSLREVEPATGKVIRRADDPGNVFGEGLALAGDRLVQLSWREGVASVYALATFEKVAEHRYAGEGWGLSYDGSRLIQSDGTDVLTFRDPRTFAETGRLAVRREGQPVFQLNELECVGGAIYANVYQTDEIVRIDGKTGAVTASIDASGLLTNEEKAAGAEVLNGIAWNPETRRFYITGKLWPKLFEVRFVPPETTASHPQRRAIR